MSSNGSLLHRLSHDPFGARRESNWSADITAASLNTVRAANSTLTSRGFTDHEHLDRTGIVHMNGRLYDPRIGRFLQPDPFVSDPANSQSHNRYAYVSNQPLALVDPSGLMAGGIEEVITSASRGGPTVVIDMRRTQIHFPEGGWTVPKMEVDGQNYEVTVRALGFVEVDPAPLEPGKDGAAGGAAWSVWDLFGISTAGAQTRPPRNGGNQSRGIGQRAMPSGGTNVQRYIPGGSLQRNEQFPNAHVLERHVGRNEAWLRDRLAREPNLWSASSFRNQTEAETFIAEALAQAPIQRMNVGSGQWFTHGFRIELGHPTGITVVPGAPAPVVATGVQVVLRHNRGSDTGYYIYTAYPD